MEHHVVVVGAGFAGVSAIRELAGDERVRVTWIDERNYHLFLPLLYQVATATVEAPDTSQPARDFIARHRNVRFVIGTADRVGRAERTVWVDGAPVHYDSLIIATGSVTADLGVPGASTYGLPLKTLDEALAMRDRIVSACEEAAQTDDPDRVRALLTFAIVGGGPTGVEMAGALAELRRHVLPAVYPEIDPQQCRVMLIASSDRLLPVLSRAASAYTERTLREYDVELHLDTRVAEVTERGVRTDDGAFIDAFTVIWAAGVSGAPIDGLPEPVKGQRIATTRSLTLPDDRDVFIVGDVSAATAPGSEKPYPQVAAVATQQGRHAARNILRRLDGKSDRPFRYRNLGTMVTVGRHRAVAERSRARITGFPAWIAWLGVHLVKLVGGRNRFMVLFSWLHMYFTRDFAVRVLYRRHRFPRSATESPISEHPTPDVPADGPDPEETPPGELFVAAEEQDSQASQHN